MIQREPAGVPAVTLTVAEVAHLVQGEVRGDGTLPISGVAPLAEAGPHDLGLLASRRYLRYLDASRAGALLVSDDLATCVAPGRTLVVVPRPHEALAPLLARLYPEPVPRSGVHPTAVVERGARLGENVSIGPYVVIGEDAVVGDGCVIGAHTVVGRGARLGSDCTLHPHVVLYPGTIVGQRVVVHSGARLGADGFGYVFVDGRYSKIPQVGGCIVEDDVEIGANSTIDRGSVGDTRVGEGSKLDNLVHLAHNVRLGAHSVLAALVGIADSARVGARAMMGGQAGVRYHVELGHDVRVAAASKVLRDVPDGETVSGNPARPHRRYLRVRAVTEKLPEIYRRLRAVERTLAEVVADRHDD